MKSTSHAVKSTCAALLIAACCMQTPRISFAVVDKVDELDKDDSKDLQCDLDGSHAILSAEKYAKYNFNKRPHDRSIESALIEKNLTLEIRTVGCVDGMSYTFTFTLAQNAAAKRDIGYWSKFAQQKLSALQLRNAPVDAPTELIAFLAKVAAMTPDKGKVAICWDDSIPDRDGCSRHTGGGYTFELKQTPNRIIIVVGRETIA